MNFDLEAGVTRTLALTDHTDGIAAAQGIGELEVIQIRRIHLHKIPLLTQAI